MPIEGEQNAGMISNFLQKKRWYKGYCANIITFLHQLNIISPVTLSQPYLPNY